MRGFPHHVARMAGTSQKPMRALLALCLLLTALGLVTCAEAAIMPVQEWVTRYSGPANTTVAVTRQVVDAAGNVYVYVTGTTVASNGHTDMVTAKYNGATGEQLWVARYDGTANGDDRPVGLGVDSAGDVIVAGASATHYTLPPVTATLTDVEYATIKYNGTTGEQIWVAHYAMDEHIGDSVPTAFAMDGQGNPFVTGYSFNRGEGRTVKYDGATGRQLFVAQYNGGASANNLYNTPVGLAVNGAGDFYLIATQEWQDPRFGRRWTYTDTVKYSGATGQMLWLRPNPSSYQGQNTVTSLTLDGTGNAIVTGATQPIYGSFDDSRPFIVKYNGGTGGQVWMNQYMSPTDSLSWVAADASGNLYGSFAWGSVFKLDANSGAKLQQLAAWGSPVFLAFDNTGNLYLMKRTIPPTIEKVDGSTGQSLWQIAYSADRVAAFTVEGGGNIYITGSSTGTGTGLDYVTSKYLQSMPTLTDVAVTGITTTGATLTWNTSARSTSQVEYGTTAAYGATLADGASVSAHSIPLTGLTPGTRYYYRVSSALVDGTVLGPVTGDFTTSVAAPTLTWGTPSPAPNAAGWNNTSVDLPFTVSPADAGTVNLPSPLHFTAEGAGQTQNVTVTDAGGTPHIFTSPALNLDFTAPQTTASLSGPLGNNGWYTGPVAVTLAATDALSGVAQTFYTLDGGAPQVYTAPLTVSAEGMHSLTFGSVDVAGNTEGTQRLTLRIDGTPPSVQWGAPTPAPNAFGWYHTAVDVPFTVSDALSGVASANPPGPLHLTAEGGSVTGSVAVTDAAGNTATYTSPAVKIDRTAPHTTATVAGAGGQNGWYVRPVTVHLEGTDVLSGVAQTFYTLDGGAAQPFTSNFTLATLGTHQLQFWSVDRASNTEATQTLTLRLEPSAPVVTISAVPPSPNAPNNKTARVNVSGTVSNTQAGLDPKQVSYSVTEGLSQPVASGPVALDKRGQYHFGLRLPGPAKGGAPRTYVITVQAVDRGGAGGQASAVVKVR